MEMSELGEDGELVEEAVGMEVVELADGDGQGGGAEGDVDLDREFGEDGVEVVDVHFEGAAVAEGGRVGCGGA